MLLTLLSSLFIKSRIIVVFLFQEIFHGINPSYREGKGTQLQYSCLGNPKDRGAWWAAVHGVAKSQTRLSDFIFTFHFHALEKEMATHSSVLAWRIPGKGEPGGLPSMGSHSRTWLKWLSSSSSSNPSYAEELSFSSLNMEINFPFLHWVVSATNWHFSRALPMTEQQMNLPSASMEMEPWAAIAVDLQQSLREVRV